METKITCLDGKTSYGKYTEGKAYKVEYLGDNDFRVYDNDNTSWYFTTNINKKPQFRMQLAKHFDCVKAVRKLKLNSLKENDVR